MSEFEQFAAHLTDPRAQNVKTLHFDLWPDLDLICDLNLKKVKPELGASRQELSNGRLARLTTKLSLNLGAKSAPPPLPSHWRSAET